MLAGAGGWGGGWGGGNSVHCTKERADSSFINVLSLLQNWQGMCPMNHRPFGDSEPHCNATLP